jgi:hypothetical protein
MLTTLGVKRKLHSQTPECRSREANGGRRSMDLRGPISTMGYKGYWEVAGGSWTSELWEISQVGELETPGGCQSGVTWHADVT